MINYHKYKNFQEYSVDVNYDVKDYQEGLDFLYNKNLKYKQMLYNILSKDEEIIKMGSTKIEKDSEVEK